MFVFSFPAQFVRYFPYMLLSKSTQLDNDKKSTFTTFDLTSYRKLELRIKYGC